MATRNPAEPSTSTCVLTVWDEDGEQAGRAPHCQESQLWDLTGAVQGEQGDGACGHLDQTKDHLSQVDIHSKVRDVEGQAVVHEDVDKPEHEGRRRRREM